MRLDYQRYACVLFDVLVFLRQLPPTCSRFFVTYSSYMSLLVLSHHSLLEARPCKHMPCDGSCLT